MLRFRTMDRECFLTVFQKNVFLSSVGWSRKMKSHPYKSTLNVITYY